MNKYKVVSIKHTKRWFGYEYGKMVDIGGIIEGTAFINPRQRFSLVRYKGYSYHRDDLRLVREFNLKDIYDL